MNSDDSRALRQLLDEQPVASLATLHRGEPAVSMVPFALPPGGVELLIHVSALAPHTRDMRGHPRVGLLVVTARAPGVPPQALPRVSLQADARMLARDGGEYPAARTAYLARFPDAEPIFGLGDFSLVALRPVSARLVAGFGRAHALVGESLSRWLLGG